MIALRDVSLSFSGRTVLEGFSCAFYKGLNWLEGESGSGKSSIIKMILADLTPDKGEVEIPAGLSFAYAGPDPSLLYDRDFKANLKKFAGGSELDEPLKRLALDFDAVKLFDSRIYRLSGGERKKMELLLALAKPADLYILDEPFSSLDRSSKDALAAYLAETKGQRNYLIVNHDSDTPLPFDHKVSIVNGKAESTAPGESIEHELEGVKAKASLLDCLLHLLFEARALTILEAIMFFLSLLSFVSLLALLPPSEDESSRVALEASPYEMALYDGNQDEVDFQSFSSSFSEADLIYLPFTNYDADNDYLSEVNAGLLSFDDAPMAVFQQENSQNFHIHPSFSYLRGDEEVKGQFEFLTEDSPFLRRLKGYERFSFLFDGGDEALILCPRSELPYVATSFLNGDFHYQDYEVDGSAVIFGPELKLTTFGVHYGLTAGPSTFTYNSDSSYSLVSRSAVGGSIRTCSVRFVPAERGETDVMSFGAYAYLSFTGSYMRSPHSARGYLLLGTSRDELLRKDLEAFRPVGTIAFEPASLLKPRLIFESLTPILALFYLLVFSFSIKTDARNLASLRLTYRRNGVKLRQANRMARLAYLLPLIGSVSFALVIYLSLSLPLVNFAQFQADYPNGYMAAFGPAYQGIGFLSFYRPSWLILLSLAYLMPSFIGALIALRKK